MSGPTSLVISVLIYPADATFLLVRDSFLDLFKQVDELVQEGICTAENDHFLSHNVRIPL